MEDVDAMAEPSNPSTQHQQDSGISRRDLLIAMGAATAAAYAAPAGAAMPGHDHSHHAAQHPELLGSVNACLDKGQRCIAHCLTSFREGDLSMADCASKVHEMQAICQAFSYLLAANSDYRERYAPLCLAACKDCAKECRKHDEHVECRQCAEACEATVKAIDSTFV
jgi:Cys-rich four helix bundle protein (predicted Tat secretion target)